MKSINKSFIKCSIAALFMVFTACSDDSSSVSVNDTDNETIKNKESSVYIFESDYQTGMLRFIENGKISEDYLEFYQDSKIVSCAGNLLILEGYGSDNLSLLDVSTNKVKWQIALEDASNPRNAFCTNNNEAWVALEGISNFIKISLKDGKIKKTINTDSFVSKGGVSPNMADLTIKGDTLYALFGRSVYDAETFSTSFPSVGLVAMFDVKEGKLLDTIPLKTKNPSSVSVVKGNLYVTTMGEYNEFWGTDADSKRGIEKLNIKEKSSELIIDGEKLGGGVYSAAFDSKNAIAYVSVYKNYGDVPVYECDLIKKSVEEIKIDDAEGSLAFDENNSILYIGNRSAKKGGVYSYEDNSLELVESLAEDGLLPYSIAIINQ